MKHPSKMAFFYLHDRNIYSVFSKYFSSQSSWARGELIREPWGGGAVSGNTTEHKRLNETQIREKRKAQRRRNCQTKGNKEK